MRFRLTIPAAAALLAVALSQSAVGSPARDAGKRSTVRAPLDIGWEGIGYGFPCEQTVPPDPMCDNGTLKPSRTPSDANGDPGHDPVTGARYYVQTVNVHYAVFGPSGTVLQLARPIRRLFEGMPPPLGYTKHPCETQDLFDPVVVFDRFVTTRRWVIIATATGSPWTCLAVSRDPDPRGLGPSQWNRYASETGGQDYAKVGIWPSGANGGSYFVSFSQDMVCAYDRQRMLDGDPKRELCKTISDGTPFRLLPSDLDGPSLNLPPAGSPNYMIGLGAAGRTSILKLWKLYVDWTAATPELEIVPANDIGVTQYDPRSDPEYRLAYRNFGVEESLVFSHTIDVLADDRVQEGVRWYELRCAIVAGISSCQSTDPAAIPEVKYDVTYAPDAVKRRFTSAAMDGARRVAVGYIIYEPVIGGLRPGLRAAKFEGGAPIGPEIVIKTGVSVPHGSLTGDYHSMSIDPFDDCSFWYTGEWADSDTQNLSFDTWVGPLPCD